MDFVEVSKTLISGCPQIAPATYESCISSLVSDFSYKQTTWQVRKLTGDRSPEAEMDPRRGTQGTSPLFRKFNSA